VEEKIHHLRFITSPRPDRIAPRTEWRMRTLTKKFGCSVLDCIKDGMFNLLWTAQWSYWTFYYQLQCELMSNNS